MWQYKSNFISIFLNQYFIIIDFDAKLEFIIFIIFILFFISALLLKVSETMPPGEPGGPSPPVILGGIIRTNGSGLSLKISIFLILIARLVKSF